MIKYTIDLVREMFAEYGYELISDTYINLTTPLKYICQKHKDKGVQEITLKALKSGQRCVYCSFESGKPCNFRLPEDIYKNETEKYGYIYCGNYVHDGFTMINFECKDHRDYGLQTATWHDVRTNHSCCKVCNGNDRSTAEFDKMVKEKFPHISVIGDYFGARKKVKVRCNIDGNEWEPYAYNLLSGCGCPVCHYNKIGDLKRIPQEIKMDKLQSIHPDIQFLSTPVLSHDNVRCKCKKCGYEWYASYDNLTKSNKPTGCPSCSKSKGEAKIDLLLREWGYKFTVEKTFNELKDINLLRFDFYLNDFNLLIEYDGEYHYGPVYSSNDARDMAQREHEYELLVKHDNMKNKYCLDHHIPLLRIPYWEYRNIDLILFDFMVEHGAIIRTK